jgi:phosphatidyl-myo-inositol dimannoside synthase
MRRTLIVTNDFPPRRGGIQSFIHALASRLDPDQLTVYAPKWDGDQRFDAQQPFEVVRHPTSLMIPEPRVARRAVAIAKRVNAETVIFGAAAPLGLLAPTLRAAGPDRFLAITHGHEAGWAALPVARQLLRRIGDTTDVVTYLGEYFRARLTSALSPAAAARMTRLAPGVDIDEFHPDPERRDLIRRRLGLPADRPVVVCVSRLVPRKGQDTLIKAWPMVTHAVPDAALLLVGDGPYAGKLRAMAGQDKSILFTGPVPGDELAAHYAAGDVFAMPCRTRRGGLDVEGLGIVYLEASACGLPVIGGDSGGAPDAILEGESGYVTNGQLSLTHRLIELLTDPAKARSMGEKGRAWTERDWTWDATAARLRALLLRVQRFDVARELLDHDVPLYPELGGELTVLDREVTG